MGTDRSQAARAAFFARRNAASQRLLIGNAVDLELDGNGRFLIPPRLREYAKLDKRAMLVGQLNKFQLWDEDAWNAMAEADLAAIKQPGGLPDELRDLIL